MANLYADCLLLCVILLFVVASSPVPGFEDEARVFVEDMRTGGVNISTTMDFCFVT